MGIHSLEKKNVDLHLNVAFLAFVIWLVLCVKSSQQVRLFLKKFFICDLILNVY